MRFSTLPTISFLLAATLMGACKKDSGNAAASAQAANSSNPSNRQGTSTLSGVARYSGSDYSQSISLGVANTMIESYLMSVHFPTKDTAIRSLAFDADTLRSYLADTSIKTLRFHMAHTSAQVQQSTGTYVGYSPRGLTLIIVGYGNDDALIKNKSGGVYEHLYPCPTYCNQQPTGLLQ